MNIKSIEIQLA
jgi:hypothetical protein